MEKQYRYPGTRPFQEDDRDLFFGRNKDIEKLTELIVLEKMVLLFSKSGYGKSSLLNAGIIPRLKEVENFQTLNIRLNDPKRTPIEILSYHLERKNEKNTFLPSKFNIPSELPNDISAKLWYYTKSIQLSEKDSPELVLIFDQFEELFHYSSSKIKIFASELASLLSPNLSISIRSLFKKKIASSRDFFTKEEADLLLKPLNLKVVFSLRSDRISLLNQLKDSIPAIFKNTYELQSLNEPQAREALLEPAGKEGDFVSPKFSFSKDAQELILNSLIDQEKEHIETFQLQLICHHAEEIIIKKQKDHPNANNLELTAAELGKPEDIFEDHYNDIIRSLQKETQHKTRILIEEKLIIAGNRVPLPESVIITEHQISAKILEKLVEKRLLRSEPNTVGGISYELSHDTLVAPIQKTAQIRRENEAEIKAEKERLDAERQAKIELDEKLEIKRRLRKTTIILVIAIIGFVFAGIAAFTTYIQTKIAEKQTSNVKALILNSRAKELMDKGMKTEALRVTEAAYTIAKDADPQTLTAIAKNLEGNFYSDFTSQLLRKKHSAVISSVVFSPDSNSILAGSWDSTAILWNLKGDKIQTFKGHSGPVTSVAFSTSRDSILTGSTDSTAILWDLKGNPIQTFHGHDHEVSSVAFAPDGKSILTGSKDKTAILWDQEGKKIQTFSGHYDWVNSVAFSPDGQMILTGSRDNTAILWDLKGNKIQTFLGHTDIVTSVAFAPNGQSILTGSWDHTAILWDLNGNKIQNLQGHKDFVSSVAFSPDGNSILTGSWDNTASLWNLNGDKIQNFEGFKSDVFSVAFSPDGKSILTGSKEETVIQWDLKGNIVQTTKGHEDAISAISFSKDGKMILTGSKDKTAILWDLEGKRIQTFQHKENVSSVAFSPDGQFLLTGSDETAVLWDLEGYKIQTFLKHDRKVSSFDFSPDSSFILTGSLNGTAMLWNLEGKEIYPFKGYKGQVNAVAFSPDGKTILTGHYEETAILWDFKTRRQRKAFPILKSQVKALAFSPDGETILTVDDRNNAMLWDINGDTIRSFKDYKFTSVAFSLDSVILGGSKDQTAFLMDLEGNKIQTFKGHKSEVSSVAFAPNRDYILTGSMDKTAILWDLKGNIIQTFPEHTEAIFDVAFLPDSTFETTSREGVKIKWDYEGIKKNRNTISSNTEQPDQNSEDFQTFKGHDGTVISKVYSKDKRYYLTGSEDKTAILWKTPLGIYEWLQSSECPIRQLSLEEEIEYGIKPEKEEEDSN